MGKKSNISLWFLIELIGAALVAYMAVDVARAYAQDTFYDKTSIARDISLQIDSIFSVPGNAYLIKENPSGYSLRISGTKVEVSENDLKAPGTFYFSKNSLNNLDIFLEKPKQIVVSKIDGKVSISENIPPQLK